MLFVLSCTDEFDAEFGAVHPPHSGKRNMKGSGTIWQKQTELEVLACGHFFGAFQEAPWKREIKNAPFAHDTLSRKHHRAIHRYSLTISSLHDASFMLNLDADPDSVPFLLSTLFEESLHA
jgi:hypothetical protein